MKFNLQNDSRIGNIVSCFLTLLALNVLWVVCCVPVITAGAATAGLHSGLRKYVAREDGAVKTFFETFRRKFKTATLVWLIALVMLLCLVMCFRIVSFADGVLRKIGVAFFCLPAMIEASVLAVVFPLIARFDLSCGNAIVNALMLAIAYFPRTLLALFLNSIPVLIIIFFPSAMASLLFIWIPIGFSVTALVIAGVFEPVFAELEERK